MDFHSSLFLKWVEVCRTPVTLLPGFRYTFDYYLKPINYCEMKVTLLYAFVLLFTFSSYAQNKYEGEIKAFEEQDKTNPPVKDPILFVGSSSLRLWSDIKEAFPDKPVLNRGFGGSTLTDVSYYYKRLIPVYKPKQIVIYCGENDIAGGKSAKDAYMEFFKLYAKIRKDMPQVPVLFISAKPAPSRWAKRAEMQEFNRLVSSFLDGEEDADYLDVWPVMLNADLRPEPTLYKSDSLHMTPEGYRRWAEVIKPLLVD
ncbi:lysophospholipase L1-like esterase [Siphonobacter sp. SORGH_AS 1065]|nr:lysophospholipase L1-like esterase [Siphonobacter sp. SORGH_AS_1065]